MLSNKQERSIGVILAQSTILRSVLNELFNECSDPVDKIASLGQEATEQIIQALSVFVPGEERLEDDHWRSLIQLLSHSFSMVTSAEQPSLEKRLRLVDHAEDLLNKLPDRAKKALGLVMVDYWRKQIADGKRQLLHQQREDAAI